MLRHRPPTETILQFRGVRPTRHCDRFNQVLARATHAGRLGGTNVSPEFHDAAFGRLTINNRRDVAYRLVEVEQLPQEVRSHVLLQDEVTTMRMEMEQLARRQLSTDTVDRSTEAEEPESDDDRCIA